MKAIFSPKAKFTKCEMAFQTCNASLTTESLQKTKNLAGIF